MVAIRITIVPRLYGGIFRKRYPLETVATERLDQKRNDVSEEGIRSDFTFLWDRLGRRILAQFYDPTVERITPKKKNAGSASTCVLWC